MKTIIITVIVAASLLALCFIVSLIRPKRTKKDQRLTNLVLPIVILLLFVGLFVGGSISRNQLRNELITLQETLKNRTADNDMDRRLDALEKRNEDLSLIIGKDEEIEKWIDSLRDQ